MFSPGSMGVVFAALVTLLLCIANTEASHNKDAKGQKVPEHLHPAGHRHDAACENVKLAIKFTTHFDLIWDDKGSDSSDELSIWRPTTMELGFFPVGDTAVTSHKSPDHAAVLVEDNGDGLVEPPRKFRKIWSDKGSSARRPVTIYEMIPPSNYTCLGDVAVKSYKKCPRPNMYRCVRLDLAQNGVIAPIWKSKHFGSKKDVSFWTVRESNFTLPTGLSTGSFIAVKSFHQPVDNMYLLDACKANLTDSEPDGQEIKNRKGHHDRSSDACDCDYHPGGCTIAHAPPPDKACYCKYKGFWTCGGEITECAQSDAYHCKNPDTSLGTCLQGDGDCEAYPERCDCNYHSGGCRISETSIAHTACKCIYRGAWTCGGKITRCVDPNSEKCTNPDSTKESCIQGNGDCGAY